VTRIVSEVEHLRRVPADVVECVEPVPPKPEVAVVPLEDGLQIGRHQLSAGAIFVGRIDTDEQHVEVAAIPRGIRHGYGARASNDRRSRDRGGNHQRVAAKRRYRTGTRT